MTEEHEEQKQVEAGEFPLRILKMARVRLN